MEQDALAEEQDAPASKQDDAERCVDLSASESDDTGLEAKENADAWTADDAKSGPHLADDERKEAEAEAWQPAAVEAEAEAEG